MAVVYKAYDIRLEREVAIKIIRKEAFPAESIDRIFKRFEREAKALARLSHPNIVKVHDSGEYEGSPYLVMEYHPGGTLKAKLGKPLAWNVVSKLMIPVANALGYAHQKGILHRDVKPSNILITENGEPMLTDFGIAKILEMSDGQTLTGTGLGVGTPEYMAPEQGLGKEVDPRADIYSLGVVLYELVTGRKPYTADTPLAVLFKHMTDPLPRPGEILPGLSEEIEKVLLKALAKDPVNRYQSMEELAGAIEKVYTSNEEKRTGQVNPKTSLAVELLEKTSDEIETSHYIETPNRSIERERLPPIVWRWIGGMIGAIVLIIGGFKAISGIRFKNNSIALETIAVNNTLSANNIMESLTQSPKALPNDTLSVIPLILTNSLINTPTRTLTPSIALSLQSTPTLQSKIVPVTQDGKYALLSLQPIANNPLDGLVSFSPNIRTFTDVPFNIQSGSNAIFQTQNHMILNFPSTLLIQVDINFPIKVYILITGGYIPQNPDGQETGVIILHFTDGKTLRQKLIPGVNLREDWSYSANPTPTAIANLDGWQNVYSEDQYRGGLLAKGYIDMITISIPESLQGEALTNLEIRDNSLDPSIKIYGITVLTASY